MGKISVCLVDDNRELVQLMEEYFGEQEDIEVIGAAYNGRECLDMLDELEPDVLVLDIIMPHIDGLGVLNTIRSESHAHNPNVIMLTAFGQEEVMKKAVDLGASYFILKPFELDNLAEQIRQVEGTDTVKQAPSKKSGGKERKKKDLEANITNSSFAP
ncbi:hypothetical protein GCM10007063_26420 [Lentibacillus kapialis]|uniref:Response regulatory domain-containing protein n=1 Tax=Lentibacillus kapialis TaxID=340214 RepID=A0A917Q0N8_9BACI|nr:hypothetical protein GCM10007063_26420 [Lentibacillus kapialis]